MTLEHESTLDGIGRIRGKEDPDRHPARLSHLPILDTATKAVEREWVAGGLGFWMLWHLYGGSEGLERYGFHPTTIRRKVSRFEESFGAHPSEFVLPGVTIDSERYWEAEGIKVGPS